jgi:hypothetical protein
MTGYIKNADSNVCVGVALLYVEFLSVAPAVCDDESSPPSLMMLVNMFFKTLHENKSCMLQFEVPGDHDGSTSAAR